MAPFSLERYADYLAWRAFKQTRDPAQDFSDFQQQARSAIAQALQEYNQHHRSGAKFETFAVTSIKLSLKRLQRQAHKRSRFLDPAPGLDAPTSECDPFFVRVRSALRSRKLSKGAQRVLRSALRSRKSANRTLLRKRLDMTCAEFDLAVAELRRY